MKALLTLNTTYLVRKMHALSVEETNLKNRLKTARSNCIDRILSESEKRSIKNMLSQGISKKAICYVYGCSYKSLSQAKH